MARDLDLALLGATGFTGGLVAERLVERLAGSDHRLGLAGRDVDGLQRLRDRLASQSAWAEDLTILHADVEDQGSLRDLAARTRVLLTTVGPYAKLGEPVVAACVEQGTDYADITGEPNFVKVLLDRYDAPARDAGVRIVNCCGFDSIPHDLGAWFTVRRLPDDQPIQVRAFVVARGQFSGGTYRSAINAIAERTSPSLGASGRTEDGRYVGSLPLRVRRVPEVNGFGVPLPTIDPQIVLRSARALPEYGPEFRYGHYARVKRIGTLAAGALGLGVAAGLAQIGPGRRLLHRLAPQPGEGPDENTRANSFFRVTFVADAADGTHLKTQVAGGDPGYDETSKMLAETGLALAFDDLPDRAGVLTPVMAAAEPLYERLTQQGIRFEVLDGS